MDANCLSNFVQDKKKKTGSLTSWFSSLHLFLMQKMMEEEVEEEEVSMVIWPPRQHYWCQLDLENNVKMFWSVLIGILITWFSTNNMHTEQKVSIQVLKIIQDCFQLVLLHSALWLAKNIAPLTQKSDAKGSTLKSPAQVSLNHMQFSYSCFKVLDGSLRYLTLLWLAVKMTLVFVPPLFY